ncbi:hypothetical protein C492_22552 [Natronococcus jeotgali DSM 18795]|uniref:Uncharacterized protein n=2 Tax=Natronococcus jeotgali TaxID=413812 RepID=L9WMB5_9EURY|nr:hypothetical protein C492_22552 [Natronococcus jeotgali DSM 18795]
MEEMMTMSDELVREARRFVKHETNSRYEPVVFTSEIAEHLGVSEKEAIEALEESPTVKEKGDGDGNRVFW